MKNIFGLVKKTFQEWQQDNAAQMAAALAYYTLFSMAPLLIIALAIAGYFFNIDTARAQLLGQIGSVAGPETAALLQTAVVNSARSSNSLAASLIGIVVLLVGASGVFSHVQFALNKIWDVPPAPHPGILNTLISHFRSFLMVLGVGFLLLVFLIASGLVSVLTASLGAGSQAAVLPELINLAFLFIIMLILFAMLYRVIPDKAITWTDVWLGAAVTALLFILGRYAIELYLSISKSGSAYGTAGALIVLLIWIYYSAQIFLLGAEFTQVYARRFGSRSGVDSTSSKLPQPSDKI